MGRNIGIVIGINGYTNMPNLAYAERDAALMRQYFEQEIQFDQVYHFAPDVPDIPADRGPAIPSTPSYANLRRFFRVRFEHPFLSRGDNVWFFFAGHGLRHQERDYLMPFDADPGDVAASGLSLHYITERLRRCGADNVVLLVDTCWNGDRRDATGGIGQEVQKGVVTIYSCSPNEFSYEIDELQQGAFTHTLLRGLRLQGEGNCATVERLNQYLRYNVPSLNRQHQKPAQTPYISVEPATKFHLILLPQQATLQDISTLREDAGEAELDGDVVLAEQLWTRVLAVSPADSRALKALRRIWSQPPPAPSLSSPPPSFPSGRRTGEAPTPSAPTLSFEVVQVDGTGTIIDRRTAHTEYERVDLGQGVTLDLVPIPGGSFEMGSPPDELKRSDSEGPQHRVTVPPFWMGRYPITQGQWRAIAALPQVNRPLKSDPSHFKGETHPVECVSWHEAVEACERLSAYTNRLYRLPSEAEWEYACRGGTTTPFHFGETTTTDLANYAGTDGDGPKEIYRKKTTPVDSFGVSNAFGLCDMHGNVWEWCQDHWHENYEDAPTDGSAWQENTPQSNNRVRILRGGSWGYYLGNCRSAYRDQFAPRNRYIDLGFRVVLAPAMLHHQAQGY